ncbi:GntR family transcriptional regulator [Rhodopirellula bahusiensis]|uniref:GntR family transcriptional regulator n=1 Tax=Rhodopirellula bahusiensis TaxID=2014065 RepID=UPI0032656B39
MTPGRHQVETHASRAYHHLRQKLISGEFKPGTRLLYGPIGKEIGVSATPVREAAGQLATEGMVELVPQIGAVVRSINEPEVQELYEVRNLIESFASARASERSTSEDIQLIAKEYNTMRELVERQKQTNSPEESQEIAYQFNQADHNFHLRIVEATGNHTLVRTSTQSNILTRVFGIWMHRQGADVMENTCNEHEKIFTAIQNGNAEAAHEAASNHILKGLQLSLQSFREA